ncbi:hypothetical protein NP493_386g01025 [Ridgeia piscesae]|uniref:Uncharacterized protein n=1 Tax=Ridgeia piscesae TaxID=27915 RepID=A0AAD9L1H3_RIDPI|nr:hypothetical protein NP493_386g01025 [Ridgeia piscesae]
MLYSFHMLKTISTSQETCVITRTIWVVLVREWAMPNSPIRAAQRNECVTTIMNSLCTLIKNKLVVSIDNPKSTKFYSVSYNIY